MGFYYYYIEWTRDDTMCVLSTQSAHSEYIAISVVITHERKQNTEIKKKKYVYQSLFFFQFWPLSGSSGQREYVQQRTWRASNEKWKKNAKQFVGWCLWTLLEYIIIEKCDTHAHHIITSVAFFHFVVFSFLILLYNLSNIHLHGLKVRTCYFVEFIEEPESYFIPWFLILHQHLHECFTFAWEI